MALSHINISVFLALNSHTCDRKVVVTLVLVLQYFEFHRMDSRGNSDKRILIER